MVKKLRKMQHIKCVNVGDCVVGKSCMILRYTRNEFPKKELTLNENQPPVVMVGKTYVQLELWDTVGQNENVHLRTSSYPQMDVFLICFSVDNRISLENVDAIWIPEVNQFCPDVSKILVACKIDLRTSVQDAVTYDEGSAVAERLGMKYCETSSLTHTGIKECFHEAIRSVLSARKAQKKKVFFGSGRKGKVIPSRPVMPPKGFAPNIEIETSKFGDDWYAMLQNPKHCDVTFILEGKHNLDAHTVVLCSASKVFAKVFGVSKSITLNSGSIPGIAAVYPKATGDQGQTEGHTQDQTEGHTKGHTQGQHMCVEISADILEKTFVRVLEFLYSGVPRFPNVEKITEDELTALDQAAEMFQLPVLQTICSNIQADQAILNHSIGTCVNEETGKTVYGHKCILSARCEVMAAMFGGHFAEGKDNTISEIIIPNTSSEVFLVVLEYMYTDRCPLEEADPVGIIIVSDKYGLKRLLNLGELYISNEVEKNFTEKIHKSEIDVIGLLLTSQNFNATQLANWCLFFISNNYIAFKRRREFSQLTGDNKTHVEKYRWPPVTYLNAVQKYNRKYGDSDDDKQCVVM